MTAKMVTIPELGIIAGTRAALGAGIGLLLADLLSAPQRRAVGWTLVALGVASTIPIIAGIFLREEKGAPADDGQPGDVPESSWHIQQRAAAEREVASSMR